MLLNIDQSESSILKFNPFGLILEKIKTEKNLKIRKFHKKIWWEVVELQKIHVHRKSNAFLFV